MRVWKKSSIQLKISTSVQDLPQKQTLTDTAQNFIKEFPRSSLLLFVLAFCHDHFQSYFRERLTCISFSPSCKQSNTRLHGAFQVAGLSMHVYHSLYVYSYLSHAHVSSTSCQCVSLFKLCGKYVGLFSSLVTLSCKIISWWRNSCIGFCSVSWIWKHRLHFSLLRLEQLLWLMCLLKSSRDVIGFFWHKVIWDPQDWVCSVPITLWAYDVN